MFKHKFIATRAERHTYIKGWFRGKFVGKLDLSRSDPRTEYFYDIEVLEGEIVARQDHLVPWMEEKAPEEFASDPVFPTSLPGKINVALHYFNGEVKHFKLALKQIRLMGCHLSEQVYGRNEVYGTITGLISGYVLHHDMMVKEIVEARQPEAANRPATVLQQPVRSLALPGSATPAAAFKEPSAGSTRFFQAAGILIALGILVIAMLVARSWIMPLLVSLGSVLGIRGLHGLVTSSVKKQSQ